LATEPFTAWFRIRVSIAGSAIARTVMKRYSDIVELLDELPPLLHLPNLPRQVDEHVLAQDPLYRKVVQAQFNGLLTKPDLISEPLVLDFFQANDDYAPRRPSVTSEFHKPDAALFNNALQAVSPKAGRESPLRRQSPMVSRSQANLLGIQPEPASDVAARRHWFHPMQRSMTLEHESTNTLERDSSDTPTRGVPRQKSMPNTWPQVTSDAASSTAAAPGSSNLLWEMPVSSNQSSFGLLAGLGNEGVRSMPDAQLASASVTVSQSSIGSLGSNSQSDAASAVSTPTKLCWDLPQNAATATPRRQYLLSTQSPFRQYLLPTREAPPGRQQDPIAEEAPSTVDVARRVHIQEEAHDDSTSHANLSTASSSVPEEASGLRAAHQLRCELKAAHQLQCGLKAAHQLPPCLEHGLHLGFHLMGMPMQMVLPVEREMKDRLLRFRRLPKRRTARRDRVGQVHIQAEVIVMSMFPRRALKRAPVQRPAEERPGRRSAHLSVPSV